MPRFMQKLPATWLEITSGRHSQVLTRSLASSPLMRPLVPGAGGRRGRFRRPLVGYEFLALGPQRHVLARFLGQPFALVVVENRLPDDAPDHARAEEVLAVK